MRLCEMILGQCRQQFIQYRDSVASSFMGYSNKLFLWKILTEKRLEIVVAQGHDKQCIHQELF